MPPKTPSTPSLSSAAPTRKLPAIPQSDASNAKTEYVNCASSSDDENYVCQEIKPSSSGKDDHDGDNDSIYELPSDNPPPLPISKPPPTTTSVKQVGCLFCTGRYGVFVKYRAVVTINTNNNASALVFE